MRTLAQIYADHQSPACWGDRGTVHSYIEVYEDLLAPVRGRVGNVMEIGIMGGESLRMWEEYFYNATVWGMDLCDQPLGMTDLRPMIAEGGHHIVLGDATDPTVIDEHFCGRSFFLVIDDASHHLADQVATYDAFRDKLTADGMFIIEDIEDLDRSRPALVSIDPARRVSIFDRRDVKGRFDDVLVRIQ